MYRMIIADDEERICKLIRNLIDWETLEVEIVGVTNDGMEAYQEILEKKPDLVITDIRMPGVDGLELIRQVRESGLDVEFIIISGYQQFDYARLAIRYGVEDYLLKPISEKELIRTVEKVLGKKQMAKKALQSQSEIQEQLKRHELSLQKNAFNNLLNGIQEPGDSLGLELEAADQVQVVLVKPDIDCDPEQYEVYLSLLKKTEEAADQVLSEMGYRYISSCKDEGIFLILQTPGEEKVEQALRQIKKQMMLQNSAFYPKFTITAGMSTVKPGLEEVARSVWEARHAVLNRLFLGTGEIIHRYDRPVSEPLKTEAVFTHADRSSFLEAAEVFHVDEIRSMIRNAGVVSYQFKNADGRFAQRLCDAFVDTYLYATASFHSESETEEIRNCWKKIFCLCVTCKEAFEQLADFLGHDLEELLEQQNQAQAKPVREAKQYLQAHFNEAVRLEDVSSMVGFNATYFSTLFKKETGENFSDYLIGLRVKRAKSLLTDTEEPVAFVSEQVGYTDLKYFTRIFKRVTGLTPSEYRKLYRKIG